MTKNNADEIIKIEEEEKKKKRKIHTKPTITGAIMLFTVRTRVLVSTHDLRN